MTSLNMESGSPMNKYHYILILTVLLLAPLAALNAQRLPRLPYCVSEAEPFRPSGWTVGAFVVYG